MNYPNNVVTIHPYFRVRPGKLEQFKELLPAFLKKTRTEKLNLFYEFTANDHEVFCREGYLGAEGLLAHIDNVGPELEQALAIADLIRLEVHGPAEEINNLRGPLAELNPAWFLRLCSL